MRALAALLVLGLAACPHDVPQDSHTGPDGRPTKARVVALKDGEAHDKGVVSYPGGDRVDWVTIEIPDHEKGALELELRWKPPRPGLLLSFDVFDQFFEPLGTGTASSKTKRELSVIAKERVHVRVFALRRGDAGSYTLDATFHENQPELGLGARPVIPDPPPLPAVPAPGPSCDKFDPANKACEAVCPAFGAPPNWPACDKTCAAGDPDDKPACLKTRPCPKVPDARFAQCTPDHWKPCDLANPDPGNPRCKDAKWPAVTGRIIRTQIVGDEREILVSRGTDQHVAADWSAVVLRGSTGKPLGAARIVRIEKGKTTLRTKLGVDQLAGNDSVLLSPP